MRTRFIAPADPPHLIQLAAELMNGRWMCSSTAKTDGYGVVEVKRSWEEVIAEIILLGMIMGVNT